MTRWRWMVALALAAAGCDGCKPDEPQQADGGAPPDAAAPEPSAPLASASAPEQEIMPEPRCPPDMVKVPRRQEPLGQGGDQPRGPLPSFCIDRFESSLVDHAGGARIPPYYAPSRRAATQAARTWESLRFEMGDPDAQLLPLPTLPAWMLQSDFEPRAVVRKGVTPNGHVSGEQAFTACRHAKKRLCSWREWRTACGGEEGWAFPYGAEYVQGRCNVFREAHPAHILHNDASIGHSDPRLNRVTFNGKPLLRPAGATRDCASRWGEDAIYDMVGNLDEWLDDPDGSFAGGFYARATKEGCEWKGSAHPIHYADYSTGVRCCADLPAAGR